MRNRAIARGFYQKQSYRSRVASNKKQENGKTQDGLGWAGLLVWCAGLGWSGLVWAGLGWSGGLGWAGVLNWGSFG